MRFVSVIFLVLVAAFVLSAPSPFHFLGGGGNGNNHRLGLPATHLRNPDKLVNPGTPNNPVNPVTPGTPIKPVNPVNPVNPGTSDKPDKSNTSDKPDKTDKPEKTDKETTTSPRPPWITLPFQPGFNAPFYVPTIFAPHTTAPIITGLNTVRSASYPALPIYSTMPMPDPTSTNMPFILERPGVSLGNVPVATPLPTIFVRNHPAFSLDVEPVAEAKEPTRVA